MTNYLIEFYLEYLNNFLTVERYAEYHDISIADCFTLLEIGKKYHKLNTGD